MRRSKIKEALERIRKAHRGHLRPNDVVDSARDPESALHGCFQWDNGKAAEAYRLWQARKLISVHVTVKDAPGAKNVRAFVSLTPDRKNGGGYRALADVMSDENLRNQMLADALAELQVFREKYEGLKALKPVIRAIDKVTARKADKPKMKKAA